MVYPKVETDFLNSMEWRCIGPHRGGRVVAVAGDVSNPGVFYFGACAGGVWKTTDGGTFWENVSDGFFATSAVGAIAVSESDPNVIYAGMGESCIRTNVCHGDGVYRSTDAGKTWSHLGLEKTRHISRIRVHPKNSELVYVSALGDVYGSNEDRGIFRSKDGGKNWEHILDRGENTGACDLSMDQRNPRILYAAFWQTHRTPWSLISGGEGSGLFKSTDEGDTWTDLTGNVGLPDGIKGRIGVAVSPAKPSRVWAIIEAVEGGLYRSDNNGDTWDRISKDRNLYTRPWYYNHVFADTQDSDTVYILNLNAWRSVDGGITFSQVTTPHGDNHDLWIDPNNPQRMIEGNDGGACVSFNSGETWSTVYNQPTGQFYHLTTDTQFPYRVYGTQQDNTAMSVPSRSHKGAIPYSDCYQVGTSESGHIAVRPDNPNIVYSGAIGSSPGGGGSLLRYDHNSGQVRSITVWPELTNGHGAKSAKYRFQWTFPIVISPHDPNTLFTTGNHVFKSTNEGTSWECISPDLTRNDVSKMEPSGGPLTKDDTGAEYYGTIFAFAESSLEQGVFWAGSDDGLIYISRDNGENWHDVTPNELPEWSLISMIETSSHKPGAAYVAATRYKWGDQRPFLFKTGDYGKTWESINLGIPEGAYTRVLREDPDRSGLLYLGTECGVYVSFDDGGSWKSLQRNLPIVPVHDLVVKEKDLVAATHGRSFWIMDDLTPLHQLMDGIGNGEDCLFKPRSSYRYLTSTGAERPGGPGKNYTLASGVIVTFYDTKTDNNERERIFLDAGKNPRSGVVVTYHLKNKPQGEVRIVFTDDHAQEIIVFTSAEGQSEPKVATEPGLNKFVWDMRYPSAHKVEGDATTDKNLDGPIGPPGTYKVNLMVEDRVYTQEFEILKDPRIPANQNDLDAQFELLIKIRDKLSQTQDAINNIRSIKTQVQEWKNRADEHSKGILPLAETIEDNVSEIEEQLIQSKFAAPLDRVNFPTRLNLKIATLTAVVGSSDAGPTEQSYQVFDELSGRINEQLEKLDKIIATDLTSFNRLIQDLGLPAVGT